jgi:hypothetical protein
MHTVGAGLNGHDLNSAAPAHAGLSRRPGEHQARHLATTRALIQGTGAKPAAFVQYRKDAGGDQGEDGGAHPVSLLSPLEHFFPETRLRHRDDFRQSQASRRGRRAVAWCDRQARQHIGFYNLAISAVFVFLVAWNFTDRLTAKPASSLHHPTASAKAEKRVPMVIVVRER